MKLEHRLSALLQLHLHSQLNTWLQWIERRQPQEDTRNIWVSGFGATYTRGFTVVVVMLVYMLQNWAWLLVPFLSNVIYKFRFASSCWKGVCYQVIYVYVGQRSVITMTSLWTRWRLKSPASWLFTQPFIQPQITENIKALRHWPLWNKIKSVRWHCLFG